MRHGGETTPAPVAPPNAKSWMRCSSSSGISASACSGVSGTCGIGGSPIGGSWTTPPTIVATGDGTAVGTAAMTSLTSCSGVLTIVGIRFDGDALAVS